MNARSYDEGGDSRRRCKRKAQDAYGATKFARLAALKERWDPGNVFRLNANVAARSRVEASDVRLGVVRRDTEADVRAADNSR